MSLELPNALHASLEKPAEATFILHAITADQAGTPQITIYAIIVHVGRTPQDMTKVLV